MDQVRVALDGEEHGRGSGCAVADFNNDKRIDLACIGASTANLKWYENLPAK